MRLTTTGYRESYAKLIPVVISIALMVWGTVTAVEFIKDKLYDRHITELEAEIDESNRQYLAMEWAASYLCDAQIADLIDFQYNDYGLTKAECTERGSHIIK